MIISKIINRLVIIENLVLDSRLTIINIEIWMINNLQILSKHAGTVDTLVSNLVYNVIREPSDRVDFWKTISKLLKPEGKAFTSKLSARQGPVVIVITKVCVSVPYALVAEIVTFVVPVVVGVPEIIPVTVSIDKPAGKPVAL